MKRKTHIFEYLGKGKQSDHKTWSNERISHEKHFLCKNYAENEHWKLVPGLFLFFENP